MPTQHEIDAEKEANNWLATLPLSVRTNTVATEVLQQHWITNSPRQMAQTLADCIKQRVWEGVAYMPAVPSKRQVRSYAPLEWLRECIGAEPDELMRVLAGQQLTKEDTEPAAIEMIRLMEEAEPATLRELWDDHQVGDSTMVGWGGLIKQCGWEAKLQEEGTLRNKPGNSGKRNADGTFANATHRVAKEDPTLDGVGRQPKDRKSRLIRTLSNLKADPEACKAKGTNTEKVSKALSRLVRGLTPSVEGAKREAGIAPKEPKRGHGLSVVGPADGVAARLIKVVGAQHAKAIALAVLDQLNE